MAKMNYTAITFEKLNLKFLIRKQNKHVDVLDCQDRLKMLGEYTQ